MSKKRMYKIHKVQYAEHYNNEGKQFCELSIEWKPTKHNKTGDPYTVKYVVKSFADAKGYVDRIVKNEVS